MMKKGMEVLSSVSTPTNQLLKQGTGVVAPKTSTCNCCRPSKQARFVWSTQIGPITNKPWKLIDCVTAAIQIRFLGKLHQSWQLRTNSRSPSLPRLYRSISDWLFRLLWPYQIWSLLYWIWWNLLTEIVLRRGLYTNSFIYSRTWNSIAVGSSSSQGASCIHMHGVASINFSFRLFGMRKTQIFVFFWQKQ